MAVETRRKKQTRRVRRAASGRVSSRSAAKSRPKRRKKYSFHGVLGDGGKRIDVSLLFVVAILLACGLAAVASASYPTAFYSEKVGTFYYIIRQGEYAAVGLAIMTLLSLFDYHYYHGKIALLLYILSLIMLVMVLSPLGTTLNNSRRWLFGFQPSEIAKLAVLLLMASLVSQSPKLVRTLKGVAICVALVTAIDVLLIREPHFSALMIVTVIALSIMFVGGIMWRYIVIAIGLCGLAAIFAYNTLGHIQDRLAVWLNPFVDAAGDGYQAVNSLIAIGSGGLLGRGVGASRQKFFYLPEPMNDFIFSVVCEELGFIGAIIIILLFAFFIAKGYQISWNAADRFGCLIGVGITTQFAFQILLNLFVDTGIAPVTGASLPFFSYGGTALVIQLAEVGILLNISRHIPPSKKNKSIRDEIFGEGKNNRKERGS